MTKINTLKSEIDTVEDIETISSKSGKNILLLVSPTGTGKTYLLNKIAKESKKVGYFSFLFNQDIKDFIDIIENKEIILVDEAHILFREELNKSIQNIFNKVKENNKIFLLASQNKKDFPQFIEEKSYILKNDFITKEINF